MASDAIRFRGKVRAKVDAGDELLVTVWIDPDGRPRDQLEVAFRFGSADTWGPPNHADRVS